jgi:GTP-binding protein
VLKRIAIIGRSNVGKSTLFNRLSGKKLALVDDRPGVTRDWQEAPAQLADLRFTIIDTAGLGGFEEADIFQQILRQTDRVIADADLLLFMIDGRDGVMPGDRELADQLRRSQKPVLVIVNKIESDSQAFGVHDAYQLGLGEPVALSAAHGRGLDALYDALRPYILTDISDISDISAASCPSVIQKEGSIIPTEEQEKKDHHAPISIAIVGRPNVGKSTLINQLLGEERLIAADRPGITRDTVTLNWQWRGQPIQLVDTPGIRRRAKVQDHLEQASVNEALYAIRFAQVVVLLVDACSPLDKQDLTLAAHVLKEGRCLVIGLNKWDMADASILREVQYTLQTSLSQVKGVPCIPISAKHGYHLDQLLQAVLHVYHQWNRRLPTAQLNQWLHMALDHHPAPLSGSRRIRLKYMTQIKTRPPTFVIFVSKPTDLPDSYIRYLTTSLGEHFDLLGVPLRLYLRKGKNPYH